MIILTGPSNSSIITEIYEQSDCFQSRLYSELHDMLEFDGSVIIIISPGLEMLCRLLNPHRRVFFKGSIIDCYNYTEKNGELMRSSNGRRHDVSSCDTEKITNISFSS